MRLAVKRAQEPMRARVVAMLVECCEVYRAGTYLAAAIEGHGMIVTALSIASASIS